MKRVIIGLFLFLSILVGDNNLIEPILLEKSPNIWYKEKKEKISFPINKVWMDIEKNIIYPIHFDKEKFKALIKHKKQIISLYKDDNLTKSAYDAIDSFKEEDDEYLISQQWFLNRYGYIYITTPFTYTFIISSSSYEGGAHPIGSNEYYNYFYNSNKDINLKDFITDIEEFKKIALKFYKREHNLKANQPLTDDNWFENKFILGDFGLRGDGIEFFYGPYIIKPYSEGYTYFFVPYEAIRNLIKKDSLIYKLSKKDYFYRIYSTANGGFLIKIKKHKSGYLIKVDLIPYKDDFEKIWLSISFPNLPKAKIETIENRGFKKIKIYPKGSKIFNKNLKRNIKSKYTLYEGVIEEPIKYKRYSMQFILHSNISPKIFIRAVSKSYAKKKFVNWVNLFERGKSDSLIKKGEQGFNNFYLEIK
ncbi:MAG: DUF3298 domain-containing protein [Epsilonproteobacteria bacterium]|nr:DUF3298 domain-containing protein [Campylobacterota bacterium]